jgi:hypothetical protein
MSQNKAEMKLDGPRDSVTAEITTQIQQHYLSLTAKRGQLSVFTHMNSIILTGLHECCRDMKFFIHHKPDLQKEFNCYIPQVWSLH